jgi:uncharacterized protein (UPF0335 family)
MSDVTAYMDRIGNVLDMIDALREDVREIYAEAKSHGFDTKALRAAVRMKRSDETEARRVELERDLMLGASKP